MCVCVLGVPTQVDQVLVNNEWVSFCFTRDRIESLSLSLSGVVSPFVLRFLGPPFVFVFSSLVSLSALCLSILLLESMEWI